MFGGYRNSKGVELFPPAASQHPVKVTVSGVDPESAAGKAILEILVPRAASYYQKMAHNYALSTIPLQRTYARLSSLDSVSAIFSGPMTTVHIHVGPRSYGVLPLWELSPDVVFIVDRAFEIAGKDWAGTDVDYPWAATTSALDKLFGEDGGVVIDGAEYVLSWTGNKIYCNGVLVADLDTVEVEGAPLDTGWPIYTRDGEKDENGDFVGDYIRDEPYVIAGGTVMGGWGVVIWHVPSRRWGYKTANRPDRLRQTYMDGSVVVYTFSVLPVDAEGAPLEGVEVVNNQVSKITSQTLPRIETSADALFGDALLTVNVSPDGRQLVYITRRYIVSFGVSLGGSPWVSPELVPQLSVGDGGIVVSGSYAQVITKQYDGGTYYGVNEHVWSGAQTTTFPALDFSYPYACLWVAPGTVGGAYTYELINLRASATPVVCTEGGGATCVATTSSVYDSFSGSCTLAAFSYIVVTYLDIPGEDPKWVADRKFAVANPMTASLAAEVVNGVGVPKLRFSFSSGTDSEVMFRGAVTQSDWGVPFGGGVQYGHGADVPMSAEDSVRGAQMYLTTSPEGLWTGVNIAASEGGELYVHVAVAADTTSHFDQVAAGIPVEAITNATPFNVMRQAGLFFVNSGTRDTEQRYRFVVDPYGQVSQTLDNLENDQYASGEVIRKYSTGVDEALSLLEEFNTMAHFEGFLMCVAKKPTTLNLLDEVHKTYDQQWYDDNGGTGWLRETYNPLVSDDSVDPPVLVPGPATGIFPVLKGEDVDIGPVSPYVDKFRRTLKAESGG